MPDRPLKNQVLEAHVPAFQRGEAEGLSPEEIAFYDALADNESAVEVMGDEKLRIIATELLNALKTNVTVDWHHRENARAGMRTLVKRILKKYGYPPISRTVRFARSLSMRSASSENLLPRRHDEADHLKAPSITCSPPHK